jgi:hypothetical protein
MKHLKRFFLTFASCCFTFVSSHAQNYHIDFTASGATSTLDSVLVENITQGLAMTIQGSDTLQLIGTVGIGGVRYGNNSGLKIYPNPIIETGYFEFYNEKTSQGVITIFDITGKLMAKENYHFEEGLNGFEISGYPSGVYALSIYTSTWQETVQFISMNQEHNKPQIIYKTTTQSKNSLKTTTKNAKSTFQMSYAAGDQMQYTGYSGLISEVVTDIPNSNKTIDFVFTSFSCESSVTFTYGGETVTYGVVESNGRCWLDRNLGASRVATSLLDTDAAGDLFQWGRAADGHQIRTSETSTTVSSTSSPTHNKYILTSDSPYDWLVPQNDSLWQGVNGINNPCPSGFRLPTLDEWEAERLTWTPNTSEGAFSSPLKLPLTGKRHFNVPSGGLIITVDYTGEYWSSSVTSTSSQLLFFTELSARDGSNNRAYGLSVRCIKD